MLTPRPYQQKIISDIRTALSIKGGNHKSIVVASPTGSGKTFIFSYIAHHASLKNNSVLIIAHKQEIYDQIITSLAGFGLVCGQVRSGFKTIHSPIMVAMAGTLVNRLHNCPHPTLIVIDEGHHGTANTWRKITSHFDGVPRIYFTATPERGDGQGLCDIAEHMIIGPSTLELVAQGWLSYPQLKHPGEEYDVKFHMDKGDFNRKEQTSFFTKPKIIGNVIEHYRQFIWKEPTICFVASLEHGAMMEKYFRSAGLKAQMIQGGQKYKKIRNNAIKGLSDGSQHIVISCDVISEGVDIPTATGAILLRLTTSLGLYLQQVGRVLRPIYAPGMSTDTAEQRLTAMAAGSKPKAYIMDHVNNRAIHGHPLALRDWTLEHKKRNHKKDDAPPITDCPACGDCYNGKLDVCPGCGHEFKAEKRIFTPPEEIAGQLADALPDVDPRQLMGIAERYSQIMAMPKKNRQKAIMGQAFKLYGTDGGKAILAQIVALAGYSDGYVNFVWKYVQKRKSS